MGMSNETPAAIDPDMFAAVFSQNWDNARHIKSERISFMNAYSVICAGVLACSRAFRLATSSESHCFSL
jgi:hypothetical protein